MIDLVLATHNSDKKSEILSLLKDLPVRIRTMDAFSDMPAIVEDGATCQANAIKKALTVAKHTGLWALADDTGLEVEALAGRPGVYAARFAGEDATYEDNCRKLLQELEGVPPEQRSARFLTVVAIVDPRLNIDTVEGILEGTVTTTPQGNEGFGYDPVFLVPDLQKTLAQLSHDEKNAVSHRGLALRKAKAVLKRKLEISTMDVGA